MIEDACGLGLRVYGLGFGVWGLGFRVQGPVRVERTLSVLVRYKKRFEAIYKSRDPSKAGLPKQFRFRTFQGLSLGFRVKG